MPSPLFPVYINQTKLIWKPDTGSPLNIISKEHFRTIDDHALIKLKSVEGEKILAANNSEIRFVGKFEANLSCNDTSVQQLIYVQDDEFQRHPLLSEAALLELGLICYHPGITVVNTVNVDKSTEVSKILQRFSKVFTGIGSLVDFEADILLDPEAKPFFHRARPIPIHLRQKAEERLKKFVEQKVLRPLPPGVPVKYCSTLFVIPKPNKPTDIRIVANFVPLNKYISRGNVVPGIRPEDLLVKLHGMKIFAKLDLNSAYHQIRLSKRASELCLVSTFMGIFQYLTLPQGLKTSGEIFDERIAIVLSNCNQTVSFRDDILIGGKDLNDLLKELCKVLNALKNANLTCDPEKTVIGVPEIKFFGQIFNSQGTKPDPSKIDAIKNAKLPPTPKALVSYLAMVQYNSCYIPRFAELSVPLRIIAKNPPESFKYSQKEIDCFTQLQKQLCTNVINYSFDSKLQTFLFCDAGKLNHEPNKRGGLSAILTQKYKNDNNNEKNFRIVHCASRIFSDVESRWSQIELESLAIRWGADRFRFYLEGCTFIIYSDCKPLIPIFQNLPPNSPPRILRQVLAIQDLDYTPVHLPGAKNLADFCSRDPVECTQNLEDFEITDALEASLVRSVRLSSVPISLDKIREETRSDPVLTILTKRIELNDWSKHKKNPLVKPYLSSAQDLYVLDGMVFKDNLILVPENIREKVTKMVHSLAHTGKTNAQNLMSTYFWFPNVTAFMEAEVALCQTCQIVTDNHQKEPLGISPTPTRPFEVVSADFKGPLKDSNYALVIIDLFSRWADVAFVSTTSYRAIKLPLLKFFAHWGHPEIFKTDNGPPFNSEEFKSFLQNMGIKHVTSTPLHPEGNAEVETFMRMLKKSIEISNVEKTDYKEEVIQMLKIKRCTPHPAHGYPPHTVVTGWKMNPGMFTGTHPKMQYMLMDIQERMNIKNKIEHSKTKTKARYDAQKNVMARDIRPGDLVWVKLTTNRKEKDLYRIVKVTGPQVLIKNTTNGKTFKRHKNRITRYLENDVKKGPDDLVPVVSEEFSEGPEDETDEEIQEDHDQEGVQERAHGEHVQPPQRPIRPPVHREVRFRPNVDVAIYDREQPMRTRSQGPAPTFPNVMAAPLETSARERAEAQNILQAAEPHQPQ